MNITVAWFGGDGELKTGAMIDVLTMHDGQIVAVVVDDSNGRIETSHLNYLTVTQAQHD